MRSVHTALANPLQRVSRGVASDPGTPPAPGDVALCEPHRGLGWCGERQWEGHRQMFPRTINDHGVCRESRRSSFGLQACSHGLWSKSHGLSNKATERFSCNTFFCPIPGFAKQAANEHAKQVYGHVIACLNKYVQLDIYSFEVIQHALFPCRSPSGIHQMKPLILKPYSVMQPTFDYHVTCVCIYIYMMNNNPIWIEPNHQSLLKLGEG